MDKVGGGKVRNDVSLSLIISLLGGAFIIVGGLALLGLFMWQGSTLTMGGVWHMYTIVYANWLTGIMIAVSLSTGVIVLAAAYKMHKKPESKRKWGILIIIGSIVGLFSVGPFGLGGVIGIIGGLMGLNRKL